MSATRTVEQMLPDERRLLEGILGEPLLQDEQVAIVRYRRPLQSDGPQKAAARAGLLALMEKAHQSAIAHGVTDEEADAAIDEAIEAIRHGKP
jgi:hypothetical protein